MSFLVVRRVVSVLVVGALVAATGDALAVSIGDALGAASASPLDTPTPAAGDVVRYADGRLTVRVTDMPLDRLLAEIAAVTHATVRGGVGARPVSIDLAPTPIAAALARVFGAESFMLTYGSDGALRTIEMLGSGTRRASGGAPTATIAATPTPHALADEEAQAMVLQRPVAVEGPLADALGGSEAPIGRVLHAAVMERDPAARAAAREAALSAFVRDPAVEAAYLSTLAPVDDAALARILQGSAGDPASVGEWMAELATRAPSPALRAKAGGVLTALQRGAAR